MAVKQERSEGSRAGEKGPQEEEVSPHLKSLAGRWLSNTYLTNPDYKILPLPSKRPHPSLACQWLQPHP